MSDLFDRLMEMGDEALNTGHYESAYHILAAALHCAQDMENVEGLLKVEQTAKTHLDYIDANAPENVMSSQAAKDRHGVNMYHQLIIIAPVRAQMIRDNQRRRDSTT